MGDRPKAVGNMTRRLLVGNLFLSPKLMNTPILRDLDVKDDPDPEFCDGKPISLVHINVTLSEEKPTTSHDGKIWRHNRVSGLIGYESDGSAYYQGESGKWEKLRGPTKS